MLYIQVYNRQGIIWDSKLEFIPDTISEGLIRDLHDVYDYIDSMHIPNYKKLGYKNRLWCIIDWCYPQHFYRIISK